MCLAVPGQILAFTNQDALTKKGKVSFGGIVKEVNLVYVPEAQVGDYVLVHVGFAISRVDPEEANRVYKYLEEIGELTEIK